MDTKKFVHRIGYLGFAFAALLVGLYVTFPAEAVGQRLAHEITKRTHGKYSVTFTDVSLFRLSGVRAEGVRLRSAAAEGSEALELRFDELRVRLRLLPLLLLKPAGSVSVVLGDGVVTADVGAGASDGAYEVELEIDSLNLAAPPLIPMLLGTPMAGTVDGKMNVEWTPDPKNATGEATLTIDQASFGPTQLQGISLPQLAAGKLELALELKAGRFRIASLTQSGGDITLKGQGSTTLRPQLAGSMLDVCFEVKPHEAFLDKNPNVKSMFELATVKFRKDGDGFLHVPLGGTLSAVKPRGGLCPKGQRQ